MRVLVCCLLALTTEILTSAPVLAAGPQISGKAVTLLLTYDQSYSRVSFSALQHQLRKTMETVGLNIEIRERSGSSTGEQFAELFLFKMKGSCDMAEGLPIDARSDERGPLAMAYSSDGIILPFGEVECNRIQRSLQRILGSNSPELYQELFGRALGLVLAHELYHMLAQSSNHTSAGVTKESLSAREMLSCDLKMSEIAQLAIRTASHSASHQ